MTILEKMIDALTCEYEWIGIRVQEAPFELGAMSHESVVWVDGEMTDEGLGGVCAIKCDESNVEDRLNYATKTYFGSHVAIIAGNRALYGDDPHEIILMDAKVVHIIR